MSPPSTKPSSAASTLTVNASSKPDKTQDPSFINRNPKPETIETPKKIVQIVTPRPKVVKGVVHIAGLALINPDLTRVAHLVMMGESPNRGSCVR
ncbi:ubiquitin carboxyl-terminal hydrolase 34-like protein [Corchorus capsularis]|uniref:Ubiquitin carboxyl-terminal hydrolase 34-like protein n=1 Tax=Corchorus capsularis TaxID=210143 RepID=A0A1R3IN00_COCAP|nr:ubiquitin carboxyl-terminal hydrolase 34-like protein [Corchorus capsularis]